MKKYSNSFFALKDSLLLISIFILLSALIGCSSAVTPTPAQTETESTEAVDATTAENSPSTTTTSEPGSDPTQEIIVEPLVDEEQLQGTVIQFVHAFGGPGSEVMAGIAQEFSLSNPYGIWVDVQAYGSEDILLSALDAEIEKGTQPTLVAVHPYELVALTQAYEPVDLAPYFEDLTWGLSTDDQTDISTVFLDQFRVGDRLIALPLAPQATVIFYNRSWAAELGFSETPDDEISFREQSSQAIKANLADLNEDNDGLGGWIINYDPQVLLSWFGAFGGEWGEDSTPKFNSDAGLETFQYLKSVYDEGYFWISRQPEPYLYFADRNALMYSGRLDQIPEQQGWMTLENNSDEWGVIGYPGSERVIMLVDSPGLMVSAGSPEEQMAAWLFAKFLIEPENQADIVQTLFTLPVRPSTIDLLPTFIDQYPQWMDAYNLIKISKPVPTAEEWGIAQWVLQDASYRVFPYEDVNLAEILEQLDATVDDLERITP